MQKVNNPIPIFVDARGALLDGGKIYLGVANGDPETDPIVAYWDSALTQVAPQPIRTVGGRIVNGATPAQIFIAEDDYCMRVRDNDNNLVDYQPRVFYNGIQYQPLDSDLTAIAALLTTPFGRNLLTLSNQAALVNAIGALPYLSNGGGSVAGDVTLVNGVLHIGTAGDTFVGNDTNGNITLNGLAGLFIRINKTRKSFDFFVDGIEASYIDASGSHTP